MNEGCHFSTNKPIHSVPGSITRIVIKNFLTYSYLDVKPGPNLNIIIGPNGSGKSSIILAIALGLAGKPSNLGRSRHIHSFIKQGTKQAEISITLLSHDLCPVTIKRIINHSKNNEWYLNNKQTQMGDVIKLVSSLNIRMDNLVQFLPQDKVSHFSKMSNIEVLKSTQMAIGAESLLFDHNSLIELYNSYQELDKTHKSNINRLEIKSKRINQIELDVQKLKELKKNQNLLHILNIKHSWLKYNSKAQEVLDIKSKITSHENLFQDILQQINDLKDELKSLDDNGLFKEAEDSFEKLKVFEDDVHKAFKSISNLDNEIVELQNSFKSNLDLEKNRHLNVTMLKKMIADNKAKIDEENQLDYQKQLTEISDSLIEKQKKLNEKQKDINKLFDEITNFENEMNLKKIELAKLSNIEKIRIKVIESDDANVIRAMEWIEANINSIPGQVEGPIALTINVRGKSSLYLENIVRKEDLKIFICSNTETCNYLIQKLRYENNLRVNISVVPNNGTKPKLDTNKIAKFGFTKVLRDLIDGKKLSLKYLEEVYDLNRIPINENDQDTSLQPFLDEIPDIKKFILGKRCYSVRRSRYGTRTKSSSSFILNNPRILKENIDEQLKFNLEESIKILSTNITDHKKLVDDQQNLLSLLRNEMNELKNEKLNVQSKIQNLFSLQNQIDIQNNKLINIESRKQDIDQLKHQSITSVKKILKKKQSQYLLIGNLMKSHFEIMKKFSKQLSFYVSESLKKKNIELRIRQLNEKEKQIQNEINELKVNYSETKQNCSKQRSKAEMISGIKPGEKLGNDLKVQLNRLSHDINEIKSQIHSISALNTVNDCNTNDDAIQEYNQSKEEIKTMKKLIENNELELKTIKEKMYSLKKSWNERIEKIIIMISHKYSNFMQNLGYSGDVILYVPDDEFDFANYGINIMVKYRNEEALQQLNSYHQSGGERSVATILYMLALQDITTVPFRCLDEINQGMDPVNERKVFNMIVNNTCEQSSSQYFLLTPKLLKGLNYHENLSIISIFPKAPLITNWDTEIYTSFMMSNNQV